MTMHIVDRTNSSQRATFATRTRRRGLALALVLGLGIAAAPVPVYAEGLTDCITDWIQANFGDSEEVTSWWNARENRIAAEKTETDLTAMVKGLEQIASGLRQTLRQMSPSDPAYGGLSGVEQAISAQATDAKTFRDKAMRDANQARSDETKAEKAVSSEARQAVLNYQASLTPACPAPQQRVEETPPKQDKPKQSADQTPGGGSGSSKPSQGHPKLGPRPAKVLSGGVGVTPAPVTITQFPAFNPPADASVASPTTTTPSVYAPYPLILPLGDRQRDTPAPSGGSPQIRSKF
jgi:hypothetical protein